MVSFILLLTPLIVPSTQTVTLEKLADWLERWRVEQESSLRLWKAESGAKFNGLEASLTTVKTEAAGIKEQDREQFEDCIGDLTLQSTDIRELLTIVGATQNATSQLLTELDTLRGRQAVSAAVQAGQVLMFVAYLLTTISIYFVKRCQKVREKTQRKEFELLEKKLLSNKAKRRAAAAKEKSAPAPSQK